MDLISKLASTLGVPDTQAQAVAGAVLGKVKEQVADEAGGAAAAQVDAAVPELSGWQAQAGALLGGGGGLGGLLGAAAGALGGQQAQDTAAIVAILAKLDIDASKAALVAPLVLSFLKDRLEPGTLQMVLKAAPLLAGGQGGGAAGGMGAAADMLGGLFGKR